MSTYQKFNNETELSKLKTKDGEIKDLKHKTEKSDHENIIKSLEINKEYYEKNYKVLNKKKILLILTEILLGSVSTITSSTLSVVKPIIGIVIFSSTAFLTNIAILITNEYVSKSKLRYTKLPDWIRVNTLMYEKTLNESMIDQKLDEKEALELKNNI